MEALRYFYGFCILFLYPLLTLIVEVRFTSLEDQFVNPLVYILNFGRHIIVIVSVELIKIVVAGSSVSGVAQCSFTQLT